MAKKPKNNRPRGANHPMAKLTDKQVEKLRAAYAKGRTTIAALAREYKLSYSYTFKICHGEAR